MAIEIIKDNNKWIYENSGAPVAETLDEDIAWTDKGPPTGIIANPNLGQITEVIHPDPPAIPKVLTPTEFHTVVGTILTNTRFGDIINNLETAAKSGGEARVIWQRYMSANAHGGRFTKEDITIISSGLVALTLMTSDERTAVLAGWP